jgi:hypothetical protein
MIKCQKNEPPFKQCCCECIHLKATHNHCTTNKPLRNQLNGKCICNIVNGYACTVNPNRLYINWPRHSPGCELHTTKEKWLNDNANKFVPSHTIKGIKKHNG